MKSFKNLHQMKSLPSVLATVLAISSCLPARADGIFRPSAFKVTFYEIGLRNSSTGARNPIFQSEAGSQVDLSSPSTINLASGFRPANGVWDQAYALISNAIVLAGTDGNGCYIRSGVSDDDTDGGWEIVTNNAALSGEATTIESSFNGSLGPISPSVATAVNGTAASSLVSYLVSSSNPTPNGGGTINRNLFIGTLASPIAISDSTSGTVTYTVDTSRALEIWGACSSVSYNNTRFNISID